MAYGKEKQTASNASLCEVFQWCCACDAAGVFACGNNSFCTGLAFDGGFMFAAGLVMWRKASDLLKSRLQAKEKEGEQRQVIAFSGAMFLVGFILCGLRFRWGWSGIPLWGSLCAAAVFLVGYSLFGLVLHQNAYLSRTIEVQSGQKVIDTGLYGLVRHPMYTATILMFLSMPLILGSWQAFPVFLLYLPIIVKRIRNEEVVLKRELAGYENYCNRLKWRLIPYIW